MDNPLWKSNTATEFFEIGSTHLILIQKFHAFAERIFVKGKNAGLY